MKLAVIGAGGYAYETIKRVWMMPDKIELIAVVSNPVWHDAGRADCLSKGVAVYDSVDQLLENINGAADMIYIPTPIHTHFALAKKCIDAGFNIGIEKPPLPVIQEHDALVEYASKHKLDYKIPVGFQYLYSDIMQDMKKRIVEGRHGRVKRIKAVAGWQRFDSYYSRNRWAGKISLDGSWILDGTINNPLSHILANELYLASDKPGQMAELASVEAELYHGHDIESEDTSSVRIMTDKGIEILFNTSLCSDETITAMVVIECEKATIEYANFKTAKITLSDGTVEQINDESEQRGNMLTKLADCLKNNEPYMVPLEMCRPFTLAVSGAFESSGEVYSIDGKFISRLDTENDVKTVIKDIDNVLKTAHSQGKLFSEVGIEWAQKGRKFDLKGYKSFPVIAKF